MVQWLEVSPAYEQTGLVVAQTAALACPSGKDCVHLWVTTDGGATWHRAAMSNGSPNRVVIGSSGGHDTLYSPDGGVVNSLMRSDDNGDTWVPVGPAGTPALLPSYPTDEAVIVATQQHRDYIARNGSTNSVLGSNGAAWDFSYMPSPSFPSGGSNSPALLIAMDQSTRQPFVFHCDATVSCSKPVPMPWPADQAGTQAIQAYLLPSADYAEHGSVFAVTPYGIYKSLDGGTTFTPSPVVAGNSTTTTTTPMMALAPGYREAGPVRTAYVAVWQAIKTTAGMRTAGGIYRTVDGGQSWAPFADQGPFSGGAQSVAVASDGRIFASYYDGSGHAGLLCSTDGQSWQAACPALQVRRAVGAASGGQAQVPAGASRSQGAACAGCTGTARASGSPGGGGGSAGGQTEVIAAGSRGTGQTSSSTAAGVLRIVGVILVCTLITAAALLRWIPGAERLRRRLWRGRMKP